MVRLHAPFPPIRIFYLLKGDSEKCHVWRNKDTSYKTGGEEKWKGKPPKKEINNRRILMTSYMTLSAVPAKSYIKCFSMNSGWEMFSRNGEDIWPFITIVPIFFGLTTLGTILNFDWFLHYVECSNVSTTY